MIALEISNICKQFEDFHGNVHVVLKDCSLNVNEGEIFGLVGLNGIGKTTLIKILLDMLNEDSGSAKFFGLDHKMPASRQNICYLPEKFMPSQYLTGFEFLEISLSFFNKKLDKEKAREMATKLDLDPNCLDNVIGKYSKGMGQKLGLMSCFLSGARLLILDEPMTGLDPKSRIMLKQTLLEYKNQGNSVFFSSHILEDIGEICDNMAVLHDTDIKFYGSPEDFKKKYNSQSAEKAFLNCINVDNK